MNQSELTERTIYLEAVGISDLDRRSAYLDVVCRGNDQLRSRVQSLLDARAAAGSFLDSPPIQSALGAVPAENNKKITQAEDARIGPYKLLEQIGEGGFGVVYMADQIEPIQRRVALKVIKVGMDTKQVIARFEAERQALALMDHPNIAKVLDAGTTESGRPYFVMELVHGVPITEYADDRRLSTKDRLQLFGQVCWAVQHAHQKGVIHRDIKPSNILVSNDGDRPVPKVIDFGIAKATQGRLTDKTLFTRFGQFIGTPSYMSPEQAQMSVVDVDTRSDIYSLGVLLYELMTGRTPLDTAELASAGYEEICHRIRDEETIAPSKRLSSLQEDELNTLAVNRRADSKEFRSAIRGDLDWIAMKAVEKDRSRRYSSADALAKDVECYLRGEPVSAVPPSTVYLLGKFFRRNQRLLTTIGLFTATLIIATITSSWLAISKSHLSSQLADEIVEKDGIQRHLGRQLKATRAAQSAAELNAYVSDMHWAYQAFEEAQLSLALDILERYRKSHGDSFEWQCLRWLCESGDALHTIRDHEDEILGVAVSCNGFIASYAADRTIRIHDLNTRAQLDSWSHSNPIRCMGFSPDGQTLAVGDQQGTVTLWSISPRDLVGTIETEVHIGPGEPQDLAFFPDRPWLVIGTPEDVQVWDWAERELLQNSSGRTGYVAISPDSKLLARGRFESAQRFALASVDSEFTELASVGQSHTSFMTDVVFSRPRGRYLATSNWDSVVKLWDVTQVCQSGHQDYGNPLSTLRGHRETVWALDFSPDGEYLASASRDNTIRLWRGRPPLNPVESPIATLRGHLRSVQDISFNPSGDRIVSVSSDKTIRIWPGTPTAERNALVGHNDWVFDVAISPDGQTLASGAFDGELRIWNSNTQELCYAEKLHTHQIFDVDFSPDGKYVASCSAVWRNDDRKNIDMNTPGAVILLDIATRETEFVKLRDEAGPRAIDFLPDNETLVIGDYGGRLSLWDLNRKGIVRDVHIDGGLIDGLCCSKDGSLISVSFQRYSDGRRELHTYRTHDLHQISRIDDLEGPWRIAFAPPIIGDDIVASGVNFFDVKKGHKLRAWADVNAYSLAFSPDGRTLATSGIDQQIRLWNVETQKEVAVISGHRGIVTGLDFSRDGSMLASSSEDKTVRIWRTMSATSDK